MRKKAKPSRYMGCHQFKFFFPPKLETHGIFARGYLKSVERKKLFNFNMPNQRFINIYEEINKENINRTNNVAAFSWFWFLMKLFVLRSDLLSQTICNLMSNDEGKKIDDVQYLVYEECRYQNVFYSECLICATIWFQMTATIFCMFKYIRHSIIFSNINSGSYSIV